MAERRTPKLAYSIAEACEASSLGRSTLYNHIKSGRLQVRRIGGRTVVPADSLHALLFGERAEGEACLEA